MSALFVSPSPLSSKNLYMTKFQNDENVKSHLFKIPQNF